MSPAPNARRRKALGQHFLADWRVAERQLAFAGLAPEDHVLEIGPGTGVLTRRMAPRVARLVAVEKDTALARRLTLEFQASPNVEIRVGDAAKDDLAPLGPFQKVVANLPYSVSSPITFNLFTAAWDLAVLMYQKEFAERLVAEVGKRAYGRLAAARTYFATAELLESVPRGAFRPPPQVASAIVRLRRHRSPPFPVASPAEYLELLRVLFSTRRKTIRSTLRHQYRALRLADPEVADRILEGWGRGDARPEEVSPAELGRLTLHLAEATQHG